MDEEEIEYDIYFQGSQDELFTFLSPLTGPNSSIFDHLDLQNIQYDRKDKKFDFNYQPIQFRNIDRQTETITYESTSVPTHSNYFYSKQIPGERALVWRAVTRMTELRPKVKDPSDSKPTEMAAQIPDKMGVEESDNELALIREEDPDNRPIRQMHDANIQPLNRNWEVSKHEYLARLCE